MGDDQASPYPVKRNPKGGRPRVPDRLALTGILFVARTGTAWELLPPELGCGSGMTCWHRLRDWQVAGVWQKVWKALHDELGLADKIDWTKAVVDSSSVRALLGGANWPQSHRLRQKRVKKACHQRQPRRNTLVDPYRRECS